MNGAAPTRTRGPVTRRAVVRLAGVLLAAGPLAAGCGDGPRLDRDVVAGGGGRLTVVFTARAARASVLDLAVVYARVRKTRVSSSSGTPAEVADGVKQGDIVDVVVLPAGPALDRVRDELVAPPVAVAVRDCPECRAGAVTGRGLPFVEFLRTGRLFTPPPSPEPPR